MKREKANYLIQSVSHSIDVLEELGKAGGEIGVTDLSKRLKLHKNNVFRLLATLEIRGFVEQNMETENYRLGAKALQLGQAYLSQNTLIGRAQPILRGMADKTGETVSLVTLHNGQIHYPVSVEPKRQVRVCSRSTGGVPAKSVAVGRLLVAHLSDAVLAEILAANTPQDAAVKSQLAEFRSTGFVSDKGISEVDVISIARVVRGTHGEVLGAIEIAAPQYRVKFEELKSSIDEAATALSSSLGGGQAQKPLSNQIERELVAARDPV